MQRQMDPVCGNLSGAVADGDPRRMSAPAAHGDSVSRLRHVPRMELCSAVSVSAGVAVSPAVLDCAVAG